jgi:AcrR family transcriptional regulator
MQYQKTEVRNRIRNAAIDEFYDKGFPLASLRKITEKAQISTSNFYTYFEDKESLFNSIVESLYDAFTVFMTNCKVLQLQNTYPDFYARIEHGFADLIKANRKQLVIILDGSQHTKYEDYHKKLISQMKLCCKHMIFHFPDEFPSENFNMFNLHIVESLLVHGLLVIARSCDTDECIEQSVKALLKYHFTGLRALIA